MIISGKIFNQQNNGIYVAIINETKKYYLVTKISNIHEHLYFGNKAKKIIIPDNAKIYSGNDNYYLTEHCILLEDVEITEDMYIQFVKRNGMNLKYVSNKTKKICEEAIRENPCSLRYADQDEELSLLAVSLNGMCLRLVNNKTIKICKMAIEQNFRAKMYIKNYRLFDK